MSAHLLVALVMLVTTMAACTSKGLRTLPPPPTTQPRPPTTAVVDYSGIELKAVPGRSTTTVVMGPGRSTLQGVVAGPEGAVPGAVVRAERLVGDGEASLQVFTNPDGTWAMPNVLGGRFRVRAWRPSDLALIKPEVFFLNDGETKNFQLQLTRYTGVAVTSAIAPNPPVVNEPANLVAQVVQQSVDDQGVVRGAPIPNLRVELVGGGDWAVATSNPTGTDGQGRATWQVRCRSTGKQALGVIVGGAEQFPLDIPDCAPQPEDPTTSTTSTTTSSSSTSSSTNTTRTTR